MSWSFWQLVLAVFIAEAGLNACKTALREGYVFANCWYAMRVYAKKGVCLLCKQRGGPPWNGKACAVCGKKQELSPPPNVLRFPLHAPSSDLPDDAA